MTDLDPPGPIDFVLIEFPGTAVGNEMAAAVTALIEGGIIRLYDIAVAQKLSDGTVVIIDLTDPALTGLDPLRPFLGARSGLLSDDDIAEAGEALDPDHIALLLVFENAWAVPFVKAALDQGGQVVASDRIPVQTIIDTLDALDAADAAS